MARHRSHSVALKRQVALYAREAPYRAAEQELSGDVRWEYDAATYGMGRERPPLAVSGFVQAGGTRQPAVLP